MASWATQRRLTYVSLGALVAVVALAVPAFLLWYKPPTCSDGVQNQGERGIDCGGPCRELCQSDFVQPNVDWAGSEQVSHGIYNLAALVENPNINGASFDAQYTFHVYDNAGQLIVQKDGTMIIPANRNTLAFVSGVSTGERIPYKVTFDFTAAPEWKKSHDTLSSILLINNDYSEDAQSSSLQSTFVNNALTPYTNVTVYAVLSDAQGNEVGFSKTFIDRLNPGVKVTAPFTWPFSHNGAVVKQDLYLVTTPVIDP